MVRIRRLDVAGFRGIPQSGVGLIFDKKSVLLFGENGTGKSSFVDAFERLLCGRVATLDGRAQGLSSDRHGPHIRAGVNRPSISIVFANPEFTYSMGDETSGIPSPLAPYLKAAKENLFILRRRDVLNFIETQPRDRYAFLRPFLPLTGVQEVENSLKQAKESATREVEIASARLRQLDDDMNKSLGIAGELTEASLVKAISDSLGEVGHPPISALEEISGAVGLLDQELARFGDTAIPGRLLSAISSLRELLDHISPGSITRLLATCKALRDKEAAEGKVFYDRVLDDGIKWIRAENRRACPLCEQPIDASATIASAQARLDSMRELIELRLDASASLSEAIAAVRTMKDSAARAMKALAALGLADLNISTLPVEEFSTKLFSLEREIIKGLTSLQLEAVESSLIFLRDGSREKSSLAERVSSLQRTVNALPSPDKARQLLSTRQRITRVAEGWNQIRSAKVSYRAATAKASQAETVYLRTLEARKEVVQELFDKLSAEIGRLYNRLHPDESHGGIRLEVREAGQASANLRASFYERTNEDPRAYYSDAHLDTLGISIFLALRRLHRERHPEFSLLVLDDVLTSNDTAHAVRFSELLLNDFSDYQVLLTTHDRIWYEHFQDIQARCRVSANYNNKVIHKWTIEEGPDLREPEDEREVLKELLTNRSAGEITSMAGRLLEHILQEMRYSG